MEATIMGYIGVNGLCRDIMGTFKRVMATCKRDPCNDELREVLRS